MDKKVDHIFLATEIRFATSEQGQCIIKDIIAFFPHNCYFVHTSDAASSFGKRPNRNEFLAKTCISGEIFKINAKIDSLICRNNIFQTPQPIQGGRKVLRFTNHNQKLNSTDQSGFKKFS